MSNTLFFAAIVVLIVGMVMFVKSNKDRQESGEWSNALQWGYLLMMIGIFGILAKFISFTAILLLFTVSTGIIWFVGKKQLKKAKEQASDNHLIDYMSGFFPIILIVFVLRTFIAEPFQIPSSSMRPGLIVGDFILVKKYSYGVRLPIINNVVIPTGQVENGDVVVFNYPENPSVSFIKRIVATPGDTVEYMNKQLSINGQLVPTQVLGQNSYLEMTQRGLMEIPVSENSEKLGTHQYNTFVVDSYPSVISQGVRETFADKDQCEYYGSDGFKCKVPQGKYFAMGDNRDNSEDSRYWGFVDDKYIIGKAALIWMNFKDMSRIGTSIQ